MVRYFAYGSNMASGVMGGRIASASDPAPAIVPGYRLVFSLPSRRWGGHAAGIEPSPGSAVWGVVWNLDDRDLAVLDEYEAAYHRIEAVPYRDGVAVEAITYVVRDDRRADAGGAPVADYLGHMIDGASEHGLPDGWVARLKAIGIDEDESL